MFSLGDLKKTKFYQEAYQEGEQKKGGFPDITGKNVRLCYKS
jgi:predicted transposase YdaD